MIVTCDLITSPLSDSTPSLNMSSSNSPSDSPSPFLPTTLQGRVALVTGGGSGIGLGIVTALGRHGAKICLMGRREAILSAAVKQLHEVHGIEAMFARGDVRSMDDCRRVVTAVTEAYGSLDILVNAAAGKSDSNREAAEQNRWEMGDGMGH